MTSGLLPGTGYAALMHGPEDGLPVLALHGWLDNAASFATLAPHLPAWRIAAVDLPGHGHSAHREPGAQYAIVDWVHDVFKMADALGWQKFGILGHSLGATIGALAAGTLPHRVTNLWLVEGLAPLTQAADGAPGRLAMHLAALEAVRRPAPVYRDEAEALAARAKAGEFKHPENLLPIVRRGLMPAPGGLSWRADPRLKLPSALRLTPELALAFLGRIAAPVVFLQASKGLPGRDAELLARQKAAVKTLKVIEIEGYHHVHLDDPGAVALYLRG